MQNFVQFRPYTAWLIAKLVERYDNTGCRTCRLVQIISDSSQGERSSFVRRRQVLIRSPCYYYATKSPRFIPVVPVASPLTMQTKNQNRSPSTQSNHALPLVRTTQHCKIDHCRTRPAIKLVIHSMAEPASNGVPRYLKYATSLR